MLSLNQIGYLRSLGSKKHRQKYHKYLAEGEKLVREALRDCPHLVTEIIAQADNYEAIAFSLPSSVKWVEASGKDMERISALTAPPGILAVMSMPAPDSLPPLTHFKRHLFFDGIGDPGNVGGILRTADWFGVQSILLGPDTAEWSNPKVVQASMGSIFRLAIRRAELEEVKQALPCVQVLAADMEGEPMEGFTWPEDGILALGSESHGLSETVLNTEVTRLTIAPASNGGAESLNVGVAAGILLHAWRQGVQK